MIELAACLVIESPFLPLTEFEELSRLLIATESPRETALLLPRDSNARGLLESAEAWQRACDLKSRCDQAAIRILCPGHPAYPVAFYDLPQPPLFLSLQGDLPRGPMLSVVGSREPTRLAVDWMREQMPLFHHKREVTIVSGGARGIDQLAHISAIEAERPTVVFNPAGLLQLYPRDLHAWREVILKGGGAIVSEFHPMAEMRKHYFLRRNRLIAALARLTFVVEARRKSGSLLTAKTAIELNRNICVLPGAPGNISSQGSTDLLFDFAQPIRDAHDLISFWDICHPQSARSLVPAAAESEDRGDQENGVGEPNTRDNGEYEVLSETLSAD